MVNEGRPSQMHLDGDFGRLQSRERTAVEHRGATSANYFRLNLASSSADARFQPR